MEINDTIKSEIIKRIEMRLKPHIFYISQLYFTGDSDVEFIVAGNSLNKETPNDIDIYSTNKNFEKFDTKIDNPCFKSKNAYTFNNEGKLLQFCNYKKKYTR